MEKNLLSEIKSAVKHWWISLILGIMFICTALFMLFNPIEGYGALVIMFSVIILVTGAAEITFAIMNRKWMSGWGWYLTGGIVDLVIGMFLISSPLLTAAVIPFILAFWFMFRGFSAIGFSIDLQRVGTKGWGWGLTYGILAIICSVLIIMNPAIGVLSSVFIVAFNFLFMGVFRIMVAFELKSLHKTGKNLEKEIEELKEGFSEFKK